MTSQPTAEEKDFATTANLPLIWQITTRQLIIAANLLRAGHEEARQKVSFYASKMPILLLYGLAAENLVKGLLVAQGTRPVEPNKNHSSIKISEEIKGHNLETLFSKAGLNLSATEKDTLNNLSWTVQAGKYPVGTKPAIQPSDPAPVWLGLTDLTIVCKLLSDVEDALRATASTTQPILPKEDICKLGLWCPCGKTA